MFERNKKKKKKKILQLIILLSWVTVQESKIDEEI